MNRPRWDSSSLSDQEATVGRHRESGAGLAFIAFTRDPPAQFVRLQRRLAARDDLGEYITHVGSAVVAVPPGARSGGYVRDTLLG